MQINSKRIGIIAGIIVVLLIARFLWVGYSLSSGGGGQVGEAVATKMANSLYSSCLKSNATKESCECMRGEVSRNGDFVNVDVTGGKVTVDQAEFAKVKQRVRDVCGLNMH